MSSLKNKRNLKISSVGNFSFSADCTYLALLKNSIESLLFTYRSVSAKYQIDVTCIGTSYNPSSNEGYSCFLSILFLFKVLFLLVFTFAIVLFFFV